MFARLFLLAAALGLAPALPSPDSAKERDSRTDLDGTWKMTRVVDSGREDAKPVGTRVEIQKGRIIGYDTESKQTYAVSYQLSPAKNPGEINMTIVEGKDKGKSAEGIFALEGDTLKICYAFDGGPRPKSFATAGQKWICLEMKREKR